MRNCLQNQIRVSAADGKITNKIKSTTYTKICFSRDRKQQKKSGKNLMQPNEANE